MGHPKYIGAGTRDMFSLSRVAVEDRPLVEQSAGHPFKGIDSFFSSGSSGYVKMKRTFEVTLSKRMYFQNDFIFGKGEKFRVSSVLRGL